MINTKVFLNLPLIFKEKVKIYPPTVYDVVKDNNYYKYLQVLTFSQEEIEDLIMEDKRKNSNSLEDYKINNNFPTPLEFLFINCSGSSHYEKIVQDAFKFFLKQEIIFLYKEKSILVGNLEEQLLSAKKLDDLVLINESNFFLKNLKII